MDATKVMLVDTVESEEEEIRQGDIVKLVATATLYDGRIIPSWAKADRWIVSKVDGDGVVINENVSGTHAIQSLVHKKNVRKV